VVSSARLSAERLTTVDIVLGRDVCGDLEAAESGVARHERHRQLCLRNRVVVDAAYHAILMAALNPRWAERSSSQLDETVAYDGRIIHSSPAVGPTGPLIRTATSA
jgi:hypothetical protein